MNTFRIVLTRAAAILVLVFAGGVASAHDYWFEPTTGADGASVLRLFVGECLKPEDEKRYEAARSLRFEARDEDGTTDLKAVATDDAQPILTLPPAAKQRLILLDRNASYIELEAGKFDAYLHDEGLEAVRASRRKSGETALPGRERYLRFLKTLVPGAAAANPVASRAAGQTLELVPEEDPGRLKPGQRLHVRLLLRAQALAGAKVELCTRDASGGIETLASVTDRNGDASFRLPPQAALAVLRTVHMHRVTDGDARADWESLWTSYSFVVRDR